MAQALIVVEHRNGKIKNTTFEILSAVKKGGFETHAILLGDGVESLASELGKFGADKIFVCENQSLKLYTAEAYSKAIAAWAKDKNYDFVFASHTPTGKDFMPQLAARLDAGLASDCTDVEISGGAVKARRPFYAGKCTAQVTFKSTGTKLITIRPNSLGTPTEQAGANAIEKISASGLDQLKTTCKELKQGSGERPDVTEAPIVISGGRSLKNAENFKILEELADLLGAGVGASRAAVDAGYRPHRDQVGQTGKVVSPSLYIACGISGAIQHLAGMRTSKTIVAINTDPEAPIFKIADYGIVGDLFEAIPLLTKEIKSLQ